MAKPRKLADVVPPDDFARRALNKITTQLDDLSDMMVEVRGGQPLTEVDNGFVGFTYLDHEAVKTLEVAARLKFDAAAIADLDEAIGVFVRLNKTRPEHGRAAAGNPRTVHKKVLETVHRCGLDYAKALEHLVDMPGLAIQVVNGPGSAGNYVEHGPSEGDVAILNSLSALATVARKNSDQANEQLKQLEATADFNKKPGRVAIGLGPLARRAIDVFLRAGGRPSKSKKTAKLSASSKFLRALQAAIPAEYQPRTVGALASAGVKKLKPPHKLCRP